MYSYIRLNTFERTELYDTSFLSFRCYKNSRFRLVIHSHNSYHQLYEKHFTNYLNDNTDNMAITTSVSVLCTCFLGGKGQRLLEHILKSYQLRRQRVVSLIQGKLLETQVKVSIECDINISPHIQYYLNFYVTVVYILYRE